MIQKNNEKETGLLTSMRVRLAFSALLESSEISSEVLHFSEPRE